MIKKLLKILLLLISILCYILPFIIGVKQKLEPLYFIVIICMFWIVAICCSFLVMGIPPCNGVQSTEQRQKREIPKNTKHELECKYEVGWKGKQVKKHLEKIKYIEKIFLLDFNPVSLTLPIRIYTKFGIYTFRINRNYSVLELTEMITKELDKEYEEYSKECL